MFRSVSLHFSFVHTLKFELGTCVLFACVLVVLSAAPAVERVFVSVIARVAVRYADGSRRTEHRNGRGCLFGNLE